MYSSNTTPFLDSKPIVSSDSGDSCDSSVSSESDAENQVQPETTSKDDSKRSRREECCMSMSFKTNAISVSKMLSERVELCLLLVCFFMFSLLSVIFYGTAFSTHNPQSARPELSTLTVIFSVLTLSCLVYLWTILPPMTMQTTNGTVRFGVRTWWRFAFVRLGCFTFMLLIVLIPLGSTSIGSPLMKFFESQNTAE